MSYKATGRNFNFINIKMILRVVGWLTMIEALFMLIPTVCAWIAEGETPWPFLLCAAITGASGGLMTLLKPGSREMGKREAFLLTASTWVILSLFGMLPFIFYGTHMNVTDAFFETMSGYTTTGMSVLDTLENVPRSIILWRSMLQWIGGLGIILFTLAVVPMLNYTGGMQLFNAEVTGITHDKLRPRVSTTAKGLWLVYIALTSLLIILLAFSDMSLFDAVNYGLSTMSTGGFTTSDMGLSSYDSVYVKSILSFFMFLGGVNFALLFNVALGNWKQILKNTTLKVYLWFIFISFLVFVINTIASGLAKEAADVTIDPLFQAISLITSTGFTESDFNDWGPTAKVMMVLLIYMGACAGSTSGGAKIDRFIVLFKFLKNEFYKLMHPNAVTTVCMNGRGTPQNVVMKSLAFIIIYAAVIVIGGLFITLLGVDLNQGLFLALSAISNAGLEPDMSHVNIWELCDLSKWILAFIMLVGRLEIFTVLLIFTPDFWKR